MDQLKYYRLTKTASVPKYGTPGSYCFDVSLDSINRHHTVYTDYTKSTDKISDDGTVRILPKSRAVLGTGLIFEIPQNHVMKVFLRSSIGIKTGLTLANQVGIIDSDYRHELFVCLRNDGNESVTLEHGDRLAQCALEKYSPLELLETKDQPSLVNGRNGGIGSTGK